MLPPVANAPGSPVVYKKTNLSPVESLPMKTIASVAASFFLVFPTISRAADDSAVKAKEPYDYAAAMKQVAAKFKGTPGVFLHLGDSITYANPNTGWARGGQGHTAEEKAFLKWTHAGERNDSDGWYLASVDVPSGRSHTAASGCRADEFIKGGKGGLPALAEIIKKYNPQLALYMLGTNDISAGRPVAAYIADVEKAIDQPWPTALSSSCPLCRLIVARRNRWTSTTPRSASWPRRSRFRWSICLPR